MIENIKNISYLLMLVVIIIVMGLFTVYKAIVKRYNALIETRINVDKQLSHIQVHLKKKFDLIPALISSVEGYSEHEKGLLTEVTSLRSQWGKATSKGRRNMSNTLETALSRLLIVHEKYPRIKADRGFRNIQRSMGYVEQELVRERKVYNKRVAQYNRRIQMFPSSIVARLFGFEEREFYTIE